MIVALELRQRPDDLDAVEPFGWRKRRAERVDEVSDFVLSGKLSVTHRADVHEIHACTALAERSDERPDARAQTEIRAVFRYARALDQRTRNAKIFRIAGYREPAPLSHLREASVRSDD